MKSRVYVARPIPAEVEAFIAKHCEYGIWREEGMIPRQILLKEIENIEGLMITGEPIDAELLEHAPRLKIVSNISVGYNNFHLDDMRSRNVLGTNTPSVLDETVADLVFGLILAAARRIPELDRFVRQGGWRKTVNGEVFGIDVHHKKLGIIGMGRIGEAIAKRARFGFSMEILYHNRRRSAGVEEKFAARYCAFEELLAEADYVVLMTPLTTETYHLMGMKEFALMKPEAIFINASRGETVNETALFEALQNGTIRAAGLDVFSPEPPQPENPLIHLPNVVAVPHIGSATNQCRFDMAMLAARNLVQGVLGDVPENLVPELSVLKS